MSENMIWILFINTRFFQPSISRLLLYLFCSVKVFCYATERCNMRCILFLHDFKKQGMLISKYFELIWYRRVENTSRKHVYVGIN